MTDHDNPGRWETAITEEVLTALDRLRLPPPAWRLLPRPDARELIASLERHFVNRPGLRWWWDDLRVPYESRQFPRDDGFRYLCRIAPDPEEVVWFLPQSDDNHPLVFEMTVADAQAVIGECHGFEYIIASRSREWMICESHHGITYAVGEVLRGRLHRADP